jgi:hypothetical protein
MRRAFSLTDSREQNRIHKIIGSRILVKAGDKKHKVTVGALHRGKQSVKVAYHYADVPMLFGKFHANSKGAGVFDDKEAGPLVCPQSDSEIRNRETSTDQPRISQSSTQPHRETGTRTPRN